MNGGNVVSTNTINKGACDTAPVIVQDGSYFGGWYTSPTFAGSAYDFSKPFTADTTLYAKWNNLDSKITYSYAGNESAAFEWDETNPSKAKVEYKLSSASAYSTADQMLIRAVDSNTARVDVIGLKGNANYDFRITTSAGTKIEVEGVAISAYDRSGYAHFNYSDGVGAYNDDGTLKDNALVIYLTEDNKNNLDGYAFADGKPVDINGYFKAGTSRSIGYLLNNRQYSNAEKEMYGIQALCFDYDAVVVRVIGKVNAEDSSDATKSLIEGLTAYDSTENGGSEGDNGRMARIVNAKNLTIEGIGTDACIYGWGMHFVSNDNLHKYEGAGTSFEVRNITFANYPEDAIGMEGTQGTKVDPSTGSITAGDSDVKADLISSVERCWIHNNSFLPGYCAKPAESDKAEGDGSCDFKRGQYYTLSYNYFVDCHKTNLIGSSDKSLQFNISMHHNWWDNCGSRIPLIRNANAHFYNNYISGDMSESPKPSLSYVTSARANSYMFAEANYYDGCKTVAELASGGVVKAYNNMYYACFNGDDSTIVSERTASVSNNCQFTYRGIDYSSFDTDSSLFYYDAQNKVSDCYITDAVTARAEAVKYAGVLKYDYDSVNTSMNKTTPQSAVSATKEGLTIDMSSAKDGSVINGVVFTNGSGSSSGFKGKGQLITFTLARDTVIDVTSSASGENCPELVGADGKVWAAKFTQVSNLTLPAGTYFIATGLKEKEATITSLKFTDGASDEEKIAAVEEAIKAIPSTVTLEQSCIDLIDAASAQYNSLPADLQARVSNANVLSNAITKLNSLRVDNVIGLIDRIGEVSVENDYLEEITAARNAYDALSAENRQAVTNYQNLVNAELAYANIAVEALQSRIDGIAAPSTADGREGIENLLAEYNAVASAYANLNVEQQGKIEGYDKITSGIATLEEMYKPYELADMIDALPDSGWTSADNSAISQAKELYGSLTEEQKAVLSPEQKTKLESAIAYYDEEMAKTVVILFQKSNPDSYYSELGVTVDGNYKSGETYTYDGQTYNDPLKMESSTTVTITVGDGKIVYLQLSKAGEIKIDGVSYESDSNGYVTVEGLSGGTHTITKDTSCNLYYIVMK